MGPTLVGGAVQPRTASFRNSGDADVTVGIPGATRSLADPAIGFPLGNRNRPPFVHPGNACTIGVAFVPRRDGSLDAQLTLNPPGSDPGALASTVHLSGFATGVPWIAVAGNGRFVGTIPVGCLACFNERSVLLSKVHSFAHTLTSLSIAAAGGRSVPIRDLGLPDPARRAGTGTSTIAHDGFGGLKQIAPAGHAQAAFAHVSAQTLRFPATRVGSRSAALRMSVSSIESAAPRITSISASGDFAVTPRCTNPVGPRGEVDVVFEPRHAGRRIGTPAEALDRVTKLRPARCPASWPRRSSDPGPKGRGRCAAVNA